MRFLIDADFPRDTRTLVVSYGHDGVDVRDIGMRKANDADIARYAIQNGLCLLTGVWGFSDIRKYPPELYFGTNREEILKREFAGERNVLTTRITALEQTAKEQSEQLSRLLAQAEKAYAQVQDIAVRAIEGSSASKSLANLQQMLADQTRRTTQEK